MTRTHKYDMDAYQVDILPMDQAQMRGVQISDGVATVRYELHGDLTLGMTIFILHG